MVAEGKLHQAGFDSYISAQALLGLVNSPTEIQECINHLRVYGTVESVIVLGVRPKTTLPLRILGTVGKALETLHL